MDGSTPISGRWKLGTTTYDNSTTTKRSENQIGSKVAPRVPVQGAKANKPDWRDRATPRRLDILQSRRVRAKLEEFVDQSHFTSPGGREGVAADLATLEDTYSLANDDSGALALLSTGESIT